MAQARQLEQDYGAVWVLSGRIETARGHFDEAERLIRHSEHLMPNPMAFAAAMEELDIRRAATRPATRPSSD